MSVRVNGSTLNNPRKNNVNCNVIRVIKNGITTIAYQRQVGSWHTTYNDVEWTLDAFDGVEYSHTETKTSHTGSTKVRVSGTLNMFDVMSQQVYEVGSFSEEEIDSSELLLAEYIDARAGYIRLYAQWIGNTIYITTVGATYPIYLLNSVITKIEEYY